MKEDVVIFSSPTHYSGFPGLTRAGDTVVASFANQSLPELRASDLHPHYAPVAEPGFAISRDGGRTWAPSAQMPAIGPADPATRDGYATSCTLEDGSVVRIQREYIRGTQEAGPTHATVTRGGTLLSEPVEIVDVGPFPIFHPFAMERLADGSLLAAGYSYERTDDGSPAADNEMNTAAFMKGTPDGRHWSYRSHIPNPHPFCFTEAGIVDMGGGRIVCILRTDWIDVPPETMPEEANGNGTIRDGYGYYLYQSESVDYGNTWSAPATLPIWGHPPFCLKLRSSNVLMVYGHRRPPFEIRGILSTDECRTWDLSTLTALHRFDPGGYDMGYPVCTEMPNGEILCAFYGYSTHDVGEKAPHAIFGTLFTEDHLLGEADAPAVTVLA